MILFVKYLQAGLIINGIKADSLIADRGYDTNEIIKAAAREGMQAVIQPRKNLKMKQPYDRNLHKIRHLVENAFLYLKQWRGIATRCAKKSSSFPANRPDSVSCAIMAQCFVTTHI